MSNQEIKADAGKLPLTLVPSKIIQDIAATRQYGVKKYGAKESWKSVEIERYRDAMYRHWLAYLDDPEGYDEESGLPHLYHVACNCAFLCELQHYKNDKLDFKDFKNSSFKERKKPRVVFENGKWIRITPDDEYKITDDEQKTMKEMFQEAINNMNVDMDGFDWNTGDYKKED